MSRPIHEVRKERIGDVEVIHVTGEIDLSNADELVDALRGTSAPGVALDFGELSYIDSAGIRAIDRGYRGLRDEGRRLVVVLPPDSPAEWLFRVTGLSQQLAAPTLAEALGLLEDREG